MCARFLFLGAETLGKALRWMKKLLFVLCLLSAVQLLAQVNTGELRLRVTDPAGLGVKASVLIQSEGTQYRSTLETTAQGSLDVQRLPYGIYQVQIEQPGFAPVSDSVVIHSQFPLEETIRLKLRTV